MSRALLLAEAEPGTREFLERHLASDGFEVLGAEAQDLALELAERVRPDLVLIGGLEDAEGPDVCRRLREGEPGRSWDRDVPVIVLGEAGADDCVLNVWGVGYRLLGDALPERRTA